MKQRIVIKLGGASLQNPATLHELAALVRGYQKRRYNVVIVHGGGPAINEELTKRNIKWQFINGQRQTTLEMMDVIDEVLAKDVNGMVVEQLKLAKINAVGMSGAENNILFCSQSNPELMQVGKVESVDATKIESVLSQFGARVPVVAPIGVGAFEEKYNVNADWAATMIAVALNAKMLIFLTDQSGILDQEKKLVPRATSQMIDKMIEDGVISGGMFTKAKAMTTAMNAGIKQVRVLHASFASLVLNAGSIGTLLTDVSAATQRGALHGRAS